VDDLSGYVGERVYNLQPPQIQIVPENPGPVSETVSRSQITGNAGLLGNLGEGVFGIFEARIMGIPLWLIAAGLAGWYLVVKPKMKAKKAYRSNSPDDDEGEGDDDEYGYEE
jgi:hypothetical protein